MAKTQDIINVAMNLMSSGAYPKAAERIKVYLSRNPKDHRARLLLADCLSRLGRTTEASTEARIVTIQAKSDDRLFATACDVLCRSGQAEAAVKLLEEKRTTTPDALYSRWVLAGQYSNDGDLDRALAVVLEAQKLSPDNTDLGLLLADIYRARGEIDQALPLYRAAQWAKPDDHSLASIIAFLLNSSASATTQEIFQSHVKFGQVISLKAADLQFAHPPTDDPERRLRVGFVSHDFNQHSVSFFLQGLFKHLDRTGFELYAYMTSRFTDPMTDVFKASSDRFIEVPQIASPELAKRVYTDKIDILIDLNGQTVGNRLHAFQLRPAPLQMTYLGYPNTTGLRTIDCRIVDSTTDPEGSEAFNTERLVRIDPCFLCYTPATERPSADRNATPRSRTTTDGSPVACCFNSATKMNPQLMHLWGRVLAKAPHASLMVKCRGAAGPESKASLFQRLTANGVPAERLSIIEPTRSVEEHLQRYYDVDLQLDSMPYNGTTTTCESLMMGVPVVTVAGDRHASRVSASILQACGLGELVASSADDYVDLAASILNDTPRLRSLQARCSSALLRGPVCDAPAFAGRFAEMLRQQWRLRCVAS